MTNLEKIQAMDAGEMASFLSEIAMDYSKCGCDSCSIGDCRYVDDESGCDVSSMKKWLESEAD